ncbi:glycosyltransferase family A protein [Ancylobacter sp. TS-1]|uniref:glycosyltransferase family A protein n=1 Tax=Ancylobacter sp. TS-1 TaxID=1850374 RepID=UPI001265B55A|nr:glycosyltransferase family A protein [Ancylobacter sp. TS-1]QFR31916.1 hypothetical protein GBB76_01610 [Ancylobacter sp. TS-1]
MLIADAPRLDLARRLYRAADPGVRAPRAVVALPARDEEERIEACLSALVGQRPGATGEDGHGLGIVLLVNNSRDATAERARRRLAATDVAHLILSVDLPAPHANAGYARGLALDVASLWVQERPGPAFLLTTDADTRVGPDWLRRNLLGLAGNCGAVAGRFEFDALEESWLPPLARRRRRRQVAYEQALLALTARLDPLPHDPWPHHGTESGASFALTLGAYRRIGGLPCVPVGEDRALAAALARHDIPIRHDPDIVVTTSARLDGRAAGGCAATLQRWCRPDSNRGDAPETLPAALRRILARRRLRDALAAGAGLRDWERRLSLPAGRLREAGDRGFGETWATALALSPVLAHRPLSPARMDAHLAAAMRLHARLERLSARDEEIQPVVVGALLREAAEGRAERADEMLARLVA